MTAKPWAARLAVGCAVLAGVAVPTPASAHQAPARCQQVSTPVSMALGEPADQRVTGTLCLPRSQPATTLQLLLPGGTYDRSYWTLRGDLPGPSYVEAMTGAGHATLAIDRLGTGRSSRPPSHRFTDNTQELVVHQLIQRLRDGELGGHRATRTVLVGHSFGSTIARMVAVTYPDDVDGLILTGESSTPDWAAFEAMATDMHLANQDPRLAGRGLDDGYLTMVPGGKSRWFYHRQTTRPAVMAIDEATPEPDVYPQDPAWGNPSINNRIRVPVLIVVGEYDRLLCGAGATDCTSSRALQAQQSAWYGPMAQLRALAAPDTGHALNLHRTAPVWYPSVLAWIDRKDMDG